VSSVFNVGRLQNKTATTKVMPVTPGDYLEASVYASTHRCNASMGVQFLTSSEAVVSTVTVANIGNNIFGSSVDPGAWPRYGGKVLVPATAAYARIFFSKGGTSSGSDSFLFLHQPMLAKTRQTTTGLSPYSPSGQTYIDGGRLMTGSVLAQSMAVTDLSAISANLGSIVVGSANIGDLSVNTLKIAGLAVTTDKIGNNAVTNGLSANMSVVLGPGNTTLSRSIVINCIGGSPVALWIRGSAFGTTTVGTLNFRILWNNTVIFQGSSSWSSGSSSPASLSYDNMLSVVSIAGTNTLLYEAYGNNVREGHFGPAILLELKK
jgi:hypothetical protein